MNPAYTSARRSRFALSVTLFTLLFVALEARLFYLQILRGEDFRERARISVIARERIPPRRGLIKDREGRVLARNVPVYSLTVTPHYVLRQDRKAIMNRLAELVHLSHAERQALEASIDDAVENNRVWEPIELPRELVAETCPDDGAPLKLAETSAEHYVCPEDGADLHPIDPKGTYCPFDRARIKWDDPKTRESAHCPKCERQFVTRPRCPEHGDALFTVSDDLVCQTCGKTWTNEVAAVNTAMHQLPGVDVVTSLRRDYPFGYDAAHVLGSINRVTAADRERWPGVYGLRDFIGRSGVERSLEQQLRGRAGESLSIKNSSGHRSTAEQVEALAGEVEFQRAVSGNDVWLSLDMRLQKEVRKAFRYYKSGGAAVIDPLTGEILAVYSKPGFDPNELSGRLDAERWREIQENPYSPLLNKGMTAYAPGSVYKIVTGLGALHDGIVTPDLTIDCPGFYEFRGRRFHCHNRSGHGQVNLVGAFKHSCDIYFYRVGEMMGMERLAKWGTRFGFGEHTGVEIAERTGIVPTKEWHAKHTSLGWQPGFTLSTAIGQGSLTATPLQVARSFAVVANGGNLLEMHLIHKIEDERGNLVQRTSPTVTAKLDATPAELSIVREGLVRVVNDPDGTAAGVALEAIVIAGKTGTAEAAQVRPDVSAAMAAWLKEDHAWFAAYAPAEDPQMVVVVFVEHGGAGSKMAAPIAQRIIQAWMRLGIYRPSGRDDAVEGLDPMELEEEPDEEAPPGDSP